MSLGSGGILRFRGMRNLTGVICIPKYFSEHIGLRVMGIAKGR